MLRTAVRSAWFRPIGATAAPSLHQGPWTARSSSSGKRALRRPARSRAAVRTAARGSSAPCPTTRGRPSLAAAKNTVYVLVSGTRGPGWRGRARESPPGGRPPPPPAAWTTAERLEGLPEIGHVSPHERNLGLWIRRLRRGNQIDVEHAVAVRVQIAHDDPPGLAAASGRCNRRHRDRFTRSRAAYRAGRDALEHGADNCRCPVGVANGPCDRRSPDEAHGVTVEAYSGSSLAGAGPLASRPPSNPCRGRFTHGRSDRSSTGRRGRCVGCSPATRTWSFARSAASPRLDPCRAG